MNNQKQSVIYIRVSTEEQAKSGYSIEAQEKNCREYASQINCNVARVFIDEGRSAKDLKRPEVQKMFTYCSNSKNKIDSIIVWKLDRLSRNNEDYHAIIKPFCLKNGTALLSATEPNEDSLASELLRNIGINFAEYERKIISARTAVGMKAKAEKGYFPAKAPLGYKNTENANGEKIIVIDESKAFYIKRAFDLYATGEYSGTKLGKILGDEGFVDRHGRNYPKRKFEWMLKNVFYIGKFVWDDVEYEGKHTPIVKKDVFYAIQKRFNKGIKARKHDIQFPYTKLIKCSHCGCYLTAELKKGRHGKGEYIYYHCTGNRGGMCKNKYVRQEVLDKSFQEMIRNLYLPKNITDTITAQMKEFHIAKNNYQNNTIQSLESKIGTLKSRIDNLYLDKLDGNITEVFWKEKHSSWTDEKNQLIRQLETIHDSDIKYYENTNLLMDFCRNAPKLYAKATSEQKRHIINIACSKLFYNGSKLDIELKPAFENIRLMSKNKNGADDGDRTHECRYHKPEP